ncbi:hypothetical protein NL676_030203 [Syzygium grande]|nr:hypothetical protein NL676_030203 [Syzygium grande]
MSQPSKRSCGWQASAAVKKGKVYGLGSSSPGQHEVGRGTSSAGTSSRRSARESELEKSGKPRESTCRKTKKMKKMEERLDAIDAER